MKVFKLNDCDTVAAKSIEEAIKWYMREYGVDEDECEDDTECDIEKEEMLVDWDSLSDEEKKNEQVTVKYGDTLYVHKTYEWVINNQYFGVETPYLIASSEF